MSLTPEQLEEGKKLLSETTPGPWHRSGLHFRNDPDPHRVKGPAIGCIPAGAVSKEPEADVETIVWLRNNSEALIETASGSGRIAGAAIGYVRARAKRNKAKTFRNSFECEVREEAEHDDHGWTSRGNASCFVRNDEERCDTCLRRDVAHEDYLTAARDMSARWQRLKRLVESLEPSAP